jgi:hypothetical protein
LKLSDARVTRTIVRGYFKGRMKAVAAPIDLVPPQMQEIHLESLLNGRFYALTFRKPGACPGPRDQ